MSDVGDKEYARMSRGLAQRYAAPDSRNTLKPIEG